MTREFGSKGYKVVANTNATPCNFFGFTVVSAATASALADPTTRAMENNTYSTDSGILNVSLPVGFYPIRGSSITLSAGTVILWLE